MILTLLNSNGDTILDYNFIVSTNELQFAYGNPYEIRIGVEIDDIKLIIGDKFSLEYFNGVKIDAILHKFEDTTIQNRKITYMCFVLPSFFKLLTNSIKSGTIYLGVNFDKYINGLKKQMEFYIFELRKKGVLLTIDKNINVSHKHTVEAMFAKEAIILDTQDMVIRNIEDIADKRRGYYTIDDKEVAITKKTIDLPTFVPFLRKSEIKGLDTYIRPILSVIYSGSLSFLNIGDKVNINDKNLVVIEKDSFEYLGNMKTTIILGSNV